MARYCVKPDTTERSCAMSKQMTKPPAPARLKRRRRSREDMIFYYVLMALPMLQLAIFYFGVNLQSICLAFQRYDPGTKDYVWDLTANLEKFIREDLTQLGFWLKIRNSLIVWACTSLTGTVLAVIFAYYIYRKHLFSGFFKLVLFLPSVLPAVMLVAMYRYSVNEGVPGFAEVLMKLDDPIRIFSSPNDGLRVSMITLFTVWISFGPQVLVYTGAMDRVDPSMLEAGRIDGANSLQEFFKIILPNISSTITTFLIIGIASIFTNQNNLFSFLEKDQIHDAESNIGYMLYEMVQSGGTTEGNHLTYAAFLGLVFTLIVAPLAFGARKLFDKGE